MGFVGEEIIFAYLERKKQHNIYNDVGSRPCSVYGFHLTRYYGCALRKDKVILILKERSNITIITFVNKQYG